MEAKKAKVTELAVYEQMVVEVRGHWQVEAEKAKMVEEVMAVEEMEVLRLLVEAEKERVDLALLAPSSV